MADDIKVQGRRGVGRPTIDESGEKLEKHMLGSGQIHPAEEKNIRIRRPVTLTSWNGLFLLLQTPNDFPASAPLRSPVYSNEPLKLHCVSVQ